jgi:signal transduction histidine kinase
MRKLVVFGCVFLLFTSSYAQTNSEIGVVKELIINLKNNRFNKIETVLKDKSKDTLSYFFNSYISAFKNNVYNKDALVKYNPEVNQKINWYYKVLFYINKGDYILNSYVASDSLAFKSYVKALDIAEKWDEPVLACEALKRINKYLFKKTNNHKLLKYYNDVHESYKYDDFENFKVEFYNLGVKMQQFFTKYSNVKPTNEDFRHLFSASKLAKNEYLDAEAYQLKGAYFWGFSKNIDSSFHYFNLAEFIYKKENHYYNKTKRSEININKGALLQQEEKFKKSIPYVEPYLKTANIQIKSSAYSLLSKAYLKGNDFERVSELLIEKEAFLNSLKQNENLIKITESKIRYQTDKKEKENLQLKSNNLRIEAQRKENQNIAIGLGGSLVLGSIIAFLIFKNTKRKQKLAEQDKEIESQKLATVLKDQELTAIDAMIEGQEKERQRIANDLHDDLGGLMANVKLHFNALKNKESPDLYDKTNNLIEEAYQKVRSVAHAKNSGVIAKQGLLKAVRNMANKVSASNKIKIEVIDHGLDNRLENSLELTLFRIIQELITNVIKHAEATEATIHLTNHEDSINIMVEDNGIGFNPSQITKTKAGMGISSIDKRVEHLEGKLTIDSEKNKGTTIIIDIPL